MGYLTRLIDKGVLTDQDEKMGHYKLTYSYHEGVSHYYLMRANEQIASISVGDGIVWVGFMYRIIIKSEREEILNAVSEIYAEELEIKTYDH